MQINEQTAVKIFARYSRNTGTQIPDYTPPKLRRPQYDYPPSEAFNLTTRYCVRLHGIIAVSMRSILFRNMKQYSLHLRGVTSQKTVIFLV
jgi:hypothetical protein